MTSALALTMVMIKASLVPFNPTITSSRRRDDNMGTVEYNDILKTHSLVIGFPLSVINTRKACLQRNSAINWRQPAFDRHFNGHWKDTRTRYGDPKEE